MSRDDETRAGAARTTPAGRRRRFRARLESEPRAVEKSKTKVDGDVEELFNLSLDMLCIANTEGRFTCVNPAFERILGWSAGELLSRPFFDFIHEDDIAATRAELAKLAQGIPTISFENRYRCSDGDYRYLRWTAQPDASRGLVFAVARDITKPRRRALELLAAKERAEAADRAKSDFLRNVSHEIRTPMNAVIGMSELALASAKDPRVRESLRTIQQSADSLLNVIGDILDFSKIEAGKVELDETECVIRDVVGDALKSLAVAGHSKGLELLGQVSPRVPEVVVGDPVKLRQVLVNLIGNAIKFTDRGEVLVEVHPGRIATGRLELRFAVHDTGPGVPSEKLESIFESFSQADSTASRRFAGSGLGLAISRRLVEIMGGRLSVESEEGVGSAFRFTVNVERPRVRSSRRRRLGRRLCGLRALIVDDNATQRRLLSETLARRGVHVTAVDGGSAAAEVAARRREDKSIDLLIVDRDLKGSSGLDLLEDLRRAGLEEASVVLMLTSVSPPDDLHRSHRMGVGALLSKPLKEVELLESLVAARGGIPRELDTAWTHGEAPKPLDVLVVEDNLTNRQVATGLLSSRGHRVEAVATGREAVSRLLERSYDVVLMDVQMPEMDGFEATAAIRRAEAGLCRRVPIIGTTALVGREDRERCFEAGMDGYLPKPIRAQELFAHVEGAVERAGEGPDPVGPDLGARPDRVDRDSALAAVNGDRALLLRVASAALHEIPGLATDLGNAVRDGRAESLRVSAHRLKGSLGIFADADLLDSLEELESMGAAAMAVGASVSGPDSGGLCDAIDLWSRTEDGIDEALAEIRDLVEGSQAMREAPGEAEEALS